MPGDVWSVSDGDARFEFALNTLRLTEGFGAREFEARTGQPFASLEPLLLAAKRDGLMVGPESGKWRPSPLGHRFLNDLQGRFLPADPAPAPASRATG